MAFESVHQSWREFDCAALLGGRAPWPRYEVTDAVTLSMAASEVQATPECPTPVTVEGRLMADPCQTAIGVKRSRFRVKLKQSARASALRYAAFLVITLRFGRSHAIVKALAEINACNDSGFAAGFAGQSTTL